MAEIQTGYVEVNGAQLYYEITGSGHPLVLCHAGIADCRMWDAQVGTFADRYLVVRYDHRGFGRSSLPAAPYSFSEDLYGLLHALGLERAHLAGASIGGKAVLDCAITHPEVVDAVIAIAAGIGDSESEPTPEELELFEKVEQVEQDGDLARVNDLEVHVWVDGPSRRPDRVDPTVREKVREMNGANLARQAGQPQATEIKLEPPTTRRLREITAPTLVIIGDQDLSVVQQAADRITVEVPSARKVVIHDSAHLPNMEHPAEFNRTVLAFLASLEA